ncbi:ZIP family metal transporter [Arthrobacter russicus]|uniref:ZIP family zinc transporter n=1 Tax=Arthrobacter russicus TaxID=172040 RepID=A0ABU1JDQ3_9MICC|nr:ZIP family metal transporter [Arthrobacter russicus]MDR6270547.1 ZIP family zinc transporter [Arthrobacter russicus]
MGLSLSLILPPVLASIIGSFAVVRWQPPGQVVSGVQHFTAGVVLAALASELLPEVKKEGNWLWAGIGFVLGVALMLGLSQFSRSMEARYENAKSLRKAAILPIGLIVAVGVDLLVDGVLVGLGSTLSFSQGLVLAAALTLEILFVGVSLTLTLKAQGIRPLIAASATSALSLFTFVGALIALFLLAGAGACRGAGFRCGGTALPGGGGTSGRSPRAPGDGAPDGVVLRGVPLRLRICRIGRMTACARAVNLRKTGTRLDRVLIDSIES